MREHTRTYERMLASGAGIEAARHCSGPDEKGLQRLVGVASLRLGGFSNDSLRIVTAPRVVGYDNTAVIAAELELPFRNAFENRLERAVLAYPLGFDRNAQDPYPGFAGALATEDTRMFAIHSDGAYSLASVFSDHDENAHPLPRDGEQAARSLYGRELAYHIEPYNHVIDAMLTLARFVE